MRETEWQPGEGEAWLRALELPTRPWAQPYLEQMGLPSALISNRRALASVAAHARTHYETLQNAKKGLPHIPALDIAATQEFVAAAMDKLGGATDRSTQEQFFSWAYRNFVWKAFASACFVWSLLLADLCRMGGLYS